MGELNLSYQDFCSLTPFELSLISKHRAEKEERDTRMQAHFFATVINYFMCTFAKNFEPISYKTILGEKEKKKKLRLSKDDPFANFIDDGE